MTDLDQIRADLRAVLAGCETRAKQLEVEHNEAIAEMNARHAALLEEYDAATEATHADWQRAHAALEALGGDERVEVPSPSTPVAATAMEYPAVAATGPRNLGGRPPTLPVDEIGKVAREARKAGGSMQAAVAAHFGITSAAAKAHLKAARNAGTLDIDAADKARRGARNGGVPWTVDWDRVVVVIQEARAIGVGARRHLMDRMGCTSSTANNWTSIAIARGLVESNEAWKQRVGKTVRNAEPGLPVFDAASSRKEPEPPAVDLTSDGEIHQPMSDARPSKPAKGEPWSLIPGRPAKPQRPAPVDLQIDVLGDPKAPNEVGLNYETIATAYREAVTANERPVQAIADRFGVPRGWVNQWIKDARTLGYLPPRDQPQVEIPAPAGALAKSRFA